jgi:nocturnin
MIVDKMLKRNWINLEASQEDTISLFTWNSLADCLAEGFTNVKDPAILSWENRRSMAIDVVKEHNYDIICLQEIDHYYDWYEPSLDKLGYSGVFQPKYNDNGDGICIFWKRDKFKVVDDMRFRYIKSSQVGLIVVLGLASNPTQKLCVGTTHLKAKPEFKDLRTSQGAVFMDSLQHIVNNHHCPVIFAGDMNDEPDSPVIKAYKSAYQSVYNDDNCKWTTWKQRSSVVKRCIDYIFYDSHWIKPVSFLAIPADEACPTMLPAPYYTSDHMALACRFKLLKR